MFTGTSSNFKRKISINIIEYMNKKLNAKIRQKNNRQQNV